MTASLGESVTAFAPATVANLGPGFDILGLALREPGDWVTARRVETPGIRLLTVDGDQGQLPLNPESNTAGIAARATLERAGLDVGIELTLRKGMPIGSGLGSSAASAAAAAWAVNLVLGTPLRRIELVEACVEAEAAVSGRHADNVAPSLLGGLVMVRSLDPLDIIRIPVPEGLRVVAVTPDFRLETRKAREALPKEVPLTSVVANSSALASFVSACHSNDLALLARSLDDVIVTPARLPLIPHGVEVLAAARASGALGCGISGSGPTIFALCHSDQVAHTVAAAMISAFARGGLTARSVVSPADCPGARMV